MNSPTFTIAVEVQVDKVRYRIGELKERFKDTTQCELEKPGKEKQVISVSAVIEEVLNPTIPWGHQEVDFLIERNEILRSSRDMQSVLDRLGFHWDYLNPEIYENIIDSFSLHRLDDQLAEYKAKLQQFIDETPITVFCGVVEKNKQHKPIPAGFRELVTKHNWKPPIYLKHVNDFRTQVAHQYNLQQCAVLLVALGKGSVIITHLVPVSVKHLIQSDPDFFKKHGVVEMELKDFPISVSNNPLCEFRKVIMMIYVIVLGNRCTISPTHERE